MTPLSRPVPAANVPLTRAISSPGHTASRTAIPANNIICLLASWTIDGNSTLSIVVIVAQKYT